MDLPAHVLLHNPTLGLKGNKGTLVAVQAHGYYEVRLGFSGNDHKVLLPIADTVIVFRDPEPVFAVDESEIER
ncbi:MAG: hypothetical protein AAF772_14005 [Acidobacteriota bacterium]